MIIIDDRLSELIDQWLEQGDLIRLEHVVIAGQGHRLIARIHSIHNNKYLKQVNDFLQLVPTYMQKIKSIHETVIRGHLTEVKNCLTRKRFALSRDQFGASPLHLAVLHNHIDILKLIIAEFPETIDGPDNVSFSFEKCQKYYPITRLFNKFNRKEEPHYITLQ